VKRKTSDAAKGKWRGILVALGISPDVLDHRHHPCPATGKGTDRFRFSEKEKYFCSCARGGDPFELLKCCKGWDFLTAAREVDRVANNVESEPIRAPIDARPRLESLWKETTKAGDEVIRYLKGRGLIVPAIIRQVVREYWQHTPNGLIKLGKYPCMVGQMKDAAGDTISLHLTYLQDGMKAPVEAPRKVLSPIGSINGTAIRLFPWQKGEPLGFAEGIETAIAAAMLHNMAVWSVVNRNGMETFDPPEGAKELHAFGDLDASFAGQAGAYRGAERLTQKGYNVTVHLPPTIGDWNDVLMAQMEGNQ
jgi:putative DNA primase/helicase